MEDVAKKEIEDRLIEFYNAYYADQINEMYVAYPQKRSIAVSIRDLAEFDSELTNELIGNPDMIIPNANSALARQAFRYAGPLPRLWSERTSLAAARGTGRWGRDTRRCQSRSR